VVGSLAVAAAVLLFAAGVAKLRTPAPAVGMLRRALPPPLRPLAGETAIRLAAGVEAIIGAAVILDGGRLVHALLAGCYLAFSVVALRLATLPQRQSCGCFGRTDSPVGVLHVALDVVAAGVAVIATVRPPGRLGGLFDGSVLVGVVGCTQAVLLAYLGFLTITALPALGAERRRALT
jgi:hypothetical protein